MEISLRSRLPTSSLQSSLLFLNATIVAKSIASILNHHQFYQQVSNTHSSTGNVITLLHCVARQLATHGYTNAMYLLASLSCSLTHLCYVFEYSSPIEIPQHSVIHLLLTF